MAALNVRKLSVTVDGSGNITCTPDPVNVSGNNLLLVFSLDSSGWAFPDNDAIVVTQGGNQLPYSSWTMKQQLASVYDANTSTGDFKYTVRVVSTTTGTSYSLDPTIKNSGT